MPSLVASGTRTFKKLETDTFGTILCPFHSAVIVDRCRGFFVCRNYFLRRGLFVFWGVGKL